MTSAGIAVGSTYVACKSLVAPRAAWMPDADWVVSGASSKLVPKEDPMGRAASARK
jgi:hypothetical protein